MGKPDVQARSGQRGGAASESAGTNSEAARRSPEGSDVEPEDPSKTPESGEDWGFEKARSGPSREARIGVALVLVLCCAFGYVLYRKFQDQKERFTEAPVASSGDESVKPTTSKSKSKSKSAGEIETAGAEQEADSASEPVQTTQANKPADSDDPFAGGQSEPDAPPQDLFEPAQSASAGRAAVTDDPAGDPFGDGSAAPAARPRSTKPAAAPAPPDDFAEFDQPPPGQTEVAAAPGQQEPEDGFSEPAPRATPARPPAGLEDPFGGPIGGQEPAEEQTEPAMEAGTQVAGMETGADEFAPAGSAAPPGRIPPTRATTRPVDDFGATQPVPRPAAQPVEPDPFAPAPPGRAVRPSAPASRPIDPAVDDFAPPARAVQRPAPGATSATGINGLQTPIYEVQPNDNYWTISKKRYGTYKYFNALARVNAERVPDPTKLRPGMKLLTPEPAALEASYPDLFARKAAPGEAPSAETSGFFLGQSGQPLYRIGSQDTLTGIARSHLGRSSRWIQIFEMNRDQLKTPEELKIGTVLRLPLDASSVRVAGPGATIR